MGLRWGCAADDVIRNTDFQFFYEGRTSEVGPVVATISRRKTKEGGNKYFQVRVRGKIVFEDFESDWNDPATLRGLEERAEKCFYDDF